MVKKKGFDLKQLVISELFFLGFFIYLLYVIIGDFFLFEGIIMWALINASIFTCPYMKKFCK